MVTEEDTPFKILHVFMTILQKPFKCDNLQLGDPR